MTPHTVMSAPAMLTTTGEDVAEVKPGDLVAFIPFAEFGIVGR